MPLLDEVGQEVHDAQVFPAAAEAAAQQEVVAPPAGLALQGRAEGVEEGLGAQRRQGALQLQQVGGAVADVGVRVGQPAHDGAAVGRGAQRLLVQIQQRHVAAVASQRVQEGGGGGGSSEEGRKQDVESGRRWSVMQISDTVSRIVCIHDCAPIHPSTLCIHFLLQPESQASDLDDGDVKSFKLLEKSGVKEIKADVL